MTPKQREAIERHGRQEGCTCSSRFTCRVCLDRCVERDIADRNTLGPACGHEHYQGIIAPEIGPEGE